MAKNQTTPSKQQITVLALSHLSKILTASAHLQKMSISMVGQQSPKVSRLTEEE